MKVSQTYIARHPETFNTVERARLEETLDSAVALTSIASPSVLDSGGPLLAEYRAAARMPV
jgi:hypothetical protein